jgi:hypothetical protein
MTTARFPSNSIADIVRLRRFEGAWMRTAPVPGRCPQRRYLLDANRDNSLPEFDSWARTNFGKSGELFRGAEGRPHSHSQT